MKVIVTGGAGFIGSHVVDLLVSLGHEVIVFDNFSTGRNSNLSYAQSLSKKLNIKFDIYNSDISDETNWEKLPEGDAIFHFAAQTSVTASWIDPEGDFNLNAGGILHLCQWIKRHRPKFCLYANTAGALYGQTDVLPTPENHQLWPDSLYGATKAFGEIYLNAFIRSMKASSEMSSIPTDDNYFTWASLRLANVYGERQVSKGEAGVLPIFCEKFIEGKAPVVFGEKVITRDYVHVSDVAEAFVTSFRLMTTQCFDFGMNVGSGIETSSEDVYKEIFNVFRSTKYFEHIKSFETPKRAPLRPGEVSRSCLNIDKIRQIVGWQPKVNFEQAVEKFVKYFIENETIVA